MRGKASGILTFGIRGGKQAGAQFQDALKLVMRLVNIGDCKSLACHPASTTHRQLSPQELSKAGVTEDTVRLSIGIEHIDDIVADVNQALSTVNADPMITSGIAEVDDSGSQETLARRLVRTHAQRVRS